MACPFDGHPPTDGKGRSLVAVDYDAPLLDWSLSEGWHSSKLSGGSPGYFETPLPLLRISEINKGIRRNSQKT